MYVDTVYTRRWVLPISRARSAGVLLCFNRVPSFGQIKRMRTLRVAFHESLSINLVGGSFGGLVGASCCPFINNVSVEMCHNSRTAACGV